MTRSGGTSFPGLPGSPCASAERGLPRVRGNCSQSWHQSHCHATTQHHRSHCDTTGPMAMPPPRNVTGPTATPLPHNGSQRKLEE